MLDRVLSHPIGDNWSGDTAERRDLKRAGTAAAEALSRVERLEMMLHPWVGFGIMPIFAPANAGVEISRRTSDSRSRWRSLRAWLSARRLASSCLAFSLIDFDSVLGRPA
jgi:hypothetical protein